MGCGTSSHVHSSETSGQDRHDSPLTADEISSRIVCSGRSYELKIDPTFSIEYAYLSQRGYYPESLDKANQDSFVVIPDFNKDSSKIFFGVFDGHGSTGDECSIYAKDVVPEILQEHLSAGVAFGDAYHRCFIEANRSLHDSHIDDKLSGTTAITVFLDGRSVHVANVGDSRAIIARREGDTLRARPLSVDQTPFRKDERERVKKCGARVLTLDQLDGLAPIHENWGINLGEEVDEDGDPPRIWSPHGNYPGTAFTRSIGDSKAEELGVVAKPELLSFDLTPADEFIVLASDGVFEFLTSQSVVDMVKQFPNPVDACRAVVAEAYKLWLNYEIRTDDITMICLYTRVSGAKAMAARGLTGTLSSRTLDPCPQLLISPEKVTQQKPVRRGMSRDKRRAQMTKDMSSVITQEDLDYNVAEHAKPKTPEELAMIKDIVKANFLFHHLNAQQRNDLFSVMEKIYVTVNQCVIRQGDVGDKFYCVESGDYEVVVRSSTPDGTKDDVVHTYHGSTHPSFGELAIMHGNPRSSSVIALTKGVLWAISCRAFRKIVMKSPTPHLIKALQKLPMFQVLTHHEVQSLADNFTEMIVEEGHVIFNEAEAPNDTFYVIKDGTITVTKKSVGEGETEVNPAEVNLRSNDHFGEQALFSGGDAVTKAVATSRAQLLQISASKFESALANTLDDIILRSRKQKQAQEKFESSVKVLKPQGLSFRKQPPSVETMQADYENHQVEYHSLIATSDTGYVGLFRNKSTSAFYSIKVFSKTQVEESQQQFSMQRQHRNASTFNDSCPYITTDMASWSDDNAYYKASRSLIVSDLSSLIMSSTPADESVVKVYAAQALLALEVIHSKAFVYRNLNPELLLVNEFGNLQLHDFRYCQSLDNDSHRTMTLCGTPEYMAPEMIAAQGHDYSVDIWALGILIYELLCGYTPFSGKALVNGPDAGENSVNEVEEETTTATELSVYAKISRYEAGSLEYPEHVSEDARDLMDKLLIPSVSDRLGCQNLIDIERGGSVIRGHPWFKDIQWIPLAAEQTTGPQFKLIEERLNKAKEMDLANLGTGKPTLKPYTGDGAWCEGF